VVPTFVDHIISVSNITRVEELKGKTGGVNRLGSIDSVSGLRCEDGHDPERQNHPRGNLKGLRSFKDCPVCHYAGTVCARGGKDGFWNLVNIGSSRFAEWYFNKREYHQTKEAAVDEANARYGRSDSHS
jgi:hypothetical protein